MLFEPPACSRREVEVIERIQDLHGALRYAISEPRRWTGVLRRVLFARAIQGSNSIEGYTVSLDDAIAAAGGDDLQEADKPSREAVTGYRTAMTYVLQLADDPHFTYSEDLIRSLHYMMLHYDLEKSPGRWRGGPIYVRNDATSEIVYEGPDSTLVPDLMGELVERLNSEDLKVHAIVRAAMSHLNLVMIHPFRDGNGRMARGLQTLVLARHGIVAAEFSSIEEYLGRHTGAYYDVLAEVGRGSWPPENDARRWVRFCLEAHYSQANRVLRRTKEAERLWSLLEEEIKRRAIPERALPALWHASAGRRVWRSLYVALVDDGSDEITEVIASRDLRLLADRGLLIPHGEKRGRFYLPSETLSDIRTRAREPRGPEEEDPFASEPPQSTMRARPGRRSS